MDGGQHGQGDDDALEEYSQMWGEDRTYLVHCSQAPEVRETSHDMRVAWEVGTPSQEAHSEASLSLLRLVEDNQHVVADNL